MIANYLRIAWRNLRKSKIYSLINLLGLATGLATCLLVHAFIANELSFDEFHSKGDRIYRLNEIQSFDGISPQHVPLTMYPMAPALQQDFPAVEAYARFLHRSSVLRHGEKQLIVKDSYYVDGAFFSIFDFPLRHGNPATALNEPGSVVLSVETAERLFGSASVIGQMVIAGERSFRISGVLENIPANSHLRIDALFPMQDGVQEWMRTNWGSNLLVTYLLLLPGSDPAPLQAQFPQFLEKHMGERGPRYYQLYLQPLRDIHLGSMHITHDYFNWQKFDRTYLYVFAMLSIFVLLIATINFMNISTARATTRSREVGVRKAIGAQRQQLARQFIGESVLQAVLALALALLLAELLLPALSDLSQRRIVLPVLSNPLLLLLSIGGVLIVGGLAGMYPALFMANFAAVQALKGEVRGAGWKSRLRNGLVVAQFTIAIGLIAGTILAQRQFDFMVNRNPGFEREQIIVLELNRTANLKYEVLKQELRRHPAIVDVTASGQRLGNNLHQISVRARGDSAEIQLTPSHLNVDLNFLDFYGIELVAGRNFSPQIARDKGDAYIINEAMVAELGWDEPLGRGFALSGKDSLGTVIGVMKDFNFNSMHHQIQPLFVSSQPWGYGELSVKIQGSAVPAALAHLEATWNHLVPDRPFAYEFLDAHFAGLYRSDAQVSQIVAIATGLAIFIACLGLFGLASIATEQRRKEIGIRKVLGASVPGLLLLLSAGFARLVLFALLLAAPMSYLLMRNWLQAFAYRITIGIDVFLFAGLAALAIALLTVSYQALRAARTNPVESLKYE